MPDVRVDIVAEDRSGPAVRSAAREFEKLGGTAKRAARDVDDLGDETGRLSRQMLEAKAAAALLGKEFQKTGDKKLLGDIEKLNREAARFGRIIKSIEGGPAKKVPFVQRLLGDLTESAKKAGLIAGDATIEGFGDAFKALPGPAKTAIIGGLVGAATLAAPYLAAIVQGAVVAGVGAGAIGIGAVLAAQDDKVKAVYSKLGGDIGSDLKRAAQPLRDEILNLAPILGYEFGSQLPRIQRVFAAVRPILGALVHDAMAAVDALAPAIERASIAGSRVLASIGQQLPGLAKSVAQLLDAFSAAGPGAADALAALVQQLSIMIKLMALGAQASAPMLNFLGYLAELTHLTPNSNKEISKLSPTLEASGQQATQAAAGYSLFASAMGNTANKAQALGDAFNRLFGEQMNVDQANLAVNVGLTNLKKTIADNTKTLDQSTQAGQENVGAILGQIEALDRKRQADIDAGNGTEEATAKANAAYEANVQALRKVLIQMGLAPAAVDALIAAYARIPKDITTTITTVYRQVGSKSGISDQATGHSRTGTEDYGGLSSWSAARYASGQRAEMGSSGGMYRTGGPAEVHSEVNVQVALDGAPFREMTARAVSGAEKRQAWRAKVGRR